MAKFRQKEFEELVEDVRKRSGLMHEININYTENVSNIGCGTGPYLVEGKIPLHVSIRTMEKANAPLRYHTVAHELAGHVKYYEEGYPAFVVVSNEEALLEKTGEGLFKVDKKMPFNIKTVDISEMPKRDVSVVIDATRIFSDSLIEYRVVNFLTPKIWRNAVQPAILEGISTVTELNGRTQDDVQRSMSKDTAITATHFLTTIEKADGPKELNIFQKRLESFFDSIKTPTYSEIREILSSLTPTYDSGLLESKHRRLVELASALSSKTT